MDGRMMAAAEFMEGLRREDLFGGLGFIDNFRIVSTTAPTWELSMEARRAFVDVLPHIRSPLEPNPRRIRDKAQRRAKTKAQRIARRRNRK